MTIEETGDTPSENDVSQLSFEDALKQLEQLVAQLEQGAVPLEESIRLYARGNELREHCDNLLRAAESKVEKIKLAQNAPAGVEPLDVE